MTTDQIDRLAAFCRLSERGYECIKTHPCNTKWLKTEGCLTVQWRPDESDDDCRVVLEECRQQRLLEDVVREMKFAHLETHGKWWEGDAMLATPAEKCEAALRVLEASE